MGILTVAVERAIPSPHLVNSRHYCPPFQEATLGTSTNPEWTSHRGQSPLSVTPPEGNTCSQARCSLTFPSGHHHSSPERLKKPFLLLLGSTLGTSSPWPLSYPLCPPAPAPHTGTRVLCTLEEGGLLCLKRCQRPGQQSSRHCPFITGRPNSQSPWDMEARPVCHGNGCVHDSRTSIPTWPHQCSRKGALFFLLFLLFYFE